MGILKVLVCLTTLYCISQSENVQYMEMDETIHYMEMDAELAISSSFGWRNCRKSDPMQIEKFSLSPDPVKEGARAAVFFNMNVGQDIAAPIKMSLSLQVEVQGHWMEVCHRIPYLQQCTLPDICQTLHLFPTCPPILTAMGFECTCPIKKGTYKTPQKMVFPIPAMGFSGNVMIHLELTKTSDNGPVGCIDVMLQILE